MPWTMESASKHTGKAKTTATKRQWSTVANSVLKQSGDEGKAIRIANAAVSKNPSKKRINKRTRGGK